MYVAEENEFIPQRVVKIEEFNRDFDEKTKLRYLNQEFKSIVNTGKVINLTNKSVILEHFEEKCKILEPQNETLLFTAKESGSFIKIMDFEDTKEHNRETLKSEILRNEYENDFNLEKGLLKVKFNSIDLSLFRNIKVENPRISRTTFESATIKSVKVSPKDFNEAKQWHSALLTKKIDHYFLSDKEFTEYSNKVTNEFDLFKNELQDITSRKALAQELNTKDDFYKIAKLITIDYLTY